MRFILAALLALSVPSLGCETFRDALKVSEVEFCVEYKGRKVCIGRVDGVWKFSADLSAQEQTELLEKVGAK